MRRKPGPIHDFWHPRVEGQIRDAIYSHPEWFNLRDEAEKRTFVNSLAKRIVGEIAAVSNMAARSGEVIAVCLPPVAADGGCVPAVSREGGVWHDAPLPRAEGGWIDCRDRLPPVPKRAKGPFLVTYQPERGKPFVTTAFFTPIGWIFQVNRLRRGLSERVTHWQEFPDPGRKKKPARRAKGGEADAA